MKIAIVMVRHPVTRISPIMPEVARLLTEWNVEVELIFPEERLTGLSNVQPEHDLYVVKSGTDLALSFAGSLHAAGANVLNPYPVAAIVRDKIVTTRILRRAAIPMPETYVTGHPATFAPLLDDGPLVVKPYRGSQGRGVQVIWDAEALTEVPTNGGPVFAQRYHEPDGLDRKIYCIGEQVFGVKRVWPARTYEQKLGEPFTVDPELREIAMQCGRAFGLSLYGIDIILSEGRPYVVDMSSFPGFKGVPDAPLRLADYIYAAGQRVLNGEPLVPAAEEMQLV